MAEALDALYLGRAHADDALAQVLKVSRVGQMARAETRLREYLLAAWNRHEKSAIRTATRMALAGKTAGEISRAVDAEMKGWAPDVQPTIDRELEHIYRLGREAGWRRATLQTGTPLSYDPPDLKSPVAKAKPVAGFEAVPLFNLVDEEAVAALKNHQTFWVGQHYEKNLSGAIAQTTRESIVEAGRDRKVAGALINERLSKQFSHVATPKGWNGTKEQYFEALAANTATVGRVNGQMRSFGQAGITRYEIEATGDERMCPVCGHMDGKIFTVQKALDLQSAIIGASSPEAVKELHPWHSEGKLLEISPKPGAAGPDDAKKLGDSGFMFPPFHYRCRCTVNVSEDAQSFESLEGYGASTEIPKATKPAPRPRPPKAAAPRTAGRAAPTAKVLDKKLTQTEYGTSVFADGDAIEGFAINARLVEDSGLPVHEFNFKMTGGYERDLERWAQRNKASKETWFYQYRERSGKGLQSLRGTMLIEGDPDFGGEAAEAFDKIFQAEGKRPKHRVLIGRNGATEGSIRFSVFTDDPAEAIAELRSFLDELGVTGGLAAPSQEAIEKAVKAKIVTQFNPELAAEKLYSRKVTKEVLDDAYKATVSANPVAAKVAADVEVKQVIKGYETLYSKTQADYLKKGGVRALYHDTAADGAKLAEILSETDGALLSSMSRFEQGKFTTGMSTFADFETGGADGFFTRIAHLDYQDKTTFNRYRLMIKSEELGRQDWWALAEDLYGSSGKREFSSRLSVPSIAKHIEDLDPTNEVMFKKGIPISSVEKVVAKNDADRAALINSLKRRGVDKIGGKKVDDFVVVRTE